MQKSKTKAKKQPMRRQRKGTKAIAVSMAPAAMSSGFSFQRPRQGDKGKAFRVSHSELVATVYGSEDYAVTNFKINPGLVETFPWLSAVGIKYEEYTVRSMRWRFVTRVGTGTNGSVILSPDYDAGDLPPGTEQEATATSNAVEDVPWKNFSTLLSTASMHPNGARKFTRASTVTGDIRNFDVGQLSIATVGMQSSSAVGKLWCDYTIDFYVPQSNPAPSTGPGVAVYEYPASFPVTPGVSTNRFGSLTPVLDSLGLGPTSATGELKLGPGNYIVRSLEAVIDEKAGQSETESGSVTNLLIDGKSGITYASNAIQGQDFPGVQCLLEQAVNVAAGTARTIAVQSIISGLAPYVAAGTKLLVYRY